MFGLHKLTSCQLKISLFPQDHDALLRERDNVERQLGEQKMALEQQKKRYEEMQVRGE